MSLRLRRQRQLRTLFLAGLAESATGQPRGLFQRILFACSLFSRIPTANVGVVSFFHHATQNDALPLQAIFTLGLKWGLSEQVTVNSQL